MTKRDLLDMAETILKQVASCPMCRGCQDNANTYFDLREMEEANNTEQDNTRTG